MEDETYLCSHCGKNWVVGKRSICKECLEEEKLDYSIEDVRYCSEELLKVANDLGLKQMSISVTFLQGILDATADTWLPIDYGEAGTGKSCFTGDWVLARTQKGKIAIVRIILDGRDFFYWLGQFGESFDLEEMTHYRPIPKGWLE